jgi:hypothetical protein
MNMDVAPYANTPDTHEDGYHGKDGKYGKHRV